MADTGIGIDVTAENELRRLYRENARIIERLTKQLIRELPEAARRAGVERKDSIETSRIYWPEDYYSILDGVDPYAMVIPDLASRMDSARIDADDDDEVKEGPLNALVLAMLARYRKAIKRLAGRSKATIKNVGFRIDDTAQKRLMQAARKAGDRDIAELVGEVDVDHVEWEREQQRLLTAPPTGGSAPKKTPTLIERHMNAVRAIVLSVAVGVGVDSAISKMKATIGITKRRADMIGEDQALKQHASAVEEMSAAANIDQYIWRSQGDSRVRQLHRQRNGQTYDNDHEFNDVSADGPPGVPPNCRCRRQYVSPRKRQAA